MNQSEADAFAQRWIAAWNSHELEPILSHYAEEIEVTSPFVAAVMDGGEATLLGKAAVREYWSRALARYPELHFVLRAAYPGVHSVVIEYLAVERLAAAECMFFDTQGMVARVIAHYRGGPLDPLP